MRRLFSNIKNVLLFWLRAQKAGVTIINEVGMDPGIDHMLTMQEIETAREQGAKVKKILNYAYF